MKATDQSTPSTLLDIVNRLDHETDFARGIAAAIHGLECPDDGQREGVRLFAEMHIEQLEEISALLMQFFRATREQATEAPTATH